VTQFLFQVPLGEAIALLVRDAEVTDHLLIWPRGCR
jgi:hypothetical protein